MIKKLLSPWTLLGSLWLLLVFIPLWQRPLLPVDETRYLSVAWEMWQRGDWLVPHLNGEVYSHKPPLLFWLINLGWMIFGVNEWWPRLLPGLFSLGNLILTIYLGRQLWPRSPEIGQLAAFILLCSGLWSAFTGAVMFDLLLTFFVLLGIIALVKAHNHILSLPVTGIGIASVKFPSNSSKLLGIAIGFGILTKGPIVLLPLLVIALSARWWQLASPPHSWYWGIFKSILLGAGIALSWAIPASIAGGEEYRAAILWGQTANRLVNSFAHNHPPWWYLPLLPVALFPWLFFPPLWRGFWQLPQCWNESGIRLGIVWTGGIFVILSLISGKQLHYLLPLFPGFALLAAYQLVNLPNDQYRRWDMVPLGVITMMMGILLLIAPQLSIITRQLPLLSSQLLSSLELEVLLLGVGMGLIIWRFRPPEAGQSFNKLKWVIPLGMVSVLLVLAIPLVALKAAGAAYDLRPISKSIATLQRQGEMVAHLGEYHGQYQFLGRLQPLPVIDEYTLCPWLVQHPDSKLIIYPNSKHNGLLNNSEYLQTYRSNYVAIVPALLMYSVCTKVIPLP